MTVDVRDILIKAAEDVTSGMWCREEYFKDCGVFPSQLVRTGLQLEEALASKRCAVGSVALAAALLGASEDEYDEARARANAQAIREHRTGLLTFNDDHLPDDPFEAGQQLAELFRQAADA